MIKFFASEALIPTRCVGLFPQHSILSFNSAAVTPWLQQNLDHIMALSNQKSVTGYASKKSNVEILDVMRN
jgi:hypothetical protein